MLLFCSFLSPFLMMCTRFSPASLAHRQAHARSTSKERAVSAGGDSLRERTRVCVAVECSRDEGDLHRAFQQQRASEGETLCKRLSTLLSTCVCESRALLPLLCVSVTFDSLHKLLTHFLLRSSSSCFLSPILLCCCSFLSPSLRSPDSLRFLPFPSPFAAA